MPARWEVQLVATHRDQDILAELDCGPELALLRRGTDIVMSGAILEEYTEPHHVKNHAEFLMAILVGFIASIHRITLECKVGTVYHVQEDGQRHAFAFADIAMLRARVMPPSLRRTFTTAPEAATQSANDIKHVLSLAKSNPPVAQVLRLRGMGEQTWVNLYKIYEIIRADVGKDSLVQKGWISRDQLKRFTQTANSVYASGDSARHAVEIAAPPRHPLALAHAIQLIDRLIERWLASRL